MDEGGDLRGVDFIIPVVVVIVDLDDQDKENHEKENDGQIPVPCDQPMLEMIDTDDGQKDEPEEDECILKNVPALGMAHKVCVRVKLDDPISFL